MNNKILKIGIMGLVATFNLAHATLNEAEFSLAAKAVQKAYEKEVESQYKLKLVVDTEYNDTTTNAYTTRMGNIQLIKVLGGFARYESIGSDEIALIACHELGHTIGGLPFKNRGDQYISSEGQADYFATATCFKQIFRDENNLDAIKDLDVPSIVDSKCSNHFATNVNEYALCVRTAIAGINLANVLATLGKVNVDINTPEQTVVVKTNLEFPSVQCRLDTYFAGALENQRPSCWFKN